MEIPEHDIPKIMQEVADYKKLYKTANKIAVQQHV